MSIPAGGIRLHLPRPRPPGTRSVLFHAQKTPANPHLPFSFSPATSSTIQYRIAYPAQVPSFGRQEQDIAVALAGVGGLSS
jgi:hypothetical protein